MPPLLYRSLVSITTHTEYNFSLKKKRRARGREREREKKKKKKKKVNMVSDNRNKVKFLCSYGGKIAIRSVDGKLRYYGGHTRVLSVDHSISFAELMVKLGEFCGYSVELRCQLPGGDLETLVSVKSDDELRSVVEEYDKTSPDSKIRAVLSPPKALKTVSPPPSMPSSIDYSSPKSAFNAMYNRYSMSYSPPVEYPAGVYRDYGSVRCGRVRFNDQLCHDPRCRKNWH